MRSKAAGWIAIAVFFIAAAVSAPAADIEYLGTPLKSKYPDGEMAYARNVWDMQLFAGRIFLGGGNSSNRRPAKNAGPVPIVAYDLKKNAFVTEDEVADEQIDLFRIIDGDLYIPGHDATGSWKRGNFYTRTPDGNWTMYRNVPDALHLYDLVKYDGRLMAGIGLYEGAAAGMTRDMGRHWKIVPLGRSRVYAFMPVGGKLLALKKFKRTSRPYFSVAQYIGDGEFSARFDINIYRMFPQTKFRRKYARAVRITPVGEKVLYIGGYKYNDHQTLPFGLYLGRMESGRYLARRIMLPKNTLPRDILCRGGTCYLLTQRDEKGRTVISVMRSDREDLLKWERILRFRYPTFARSFEYADGAFYFGMGSDVDPQLWRPESIPVQTGDVLRIRYKER